MSIAFESPTSRSQSKDAYFTPLNMPTLVGASSVSDGTNASTTNNGSTTPYFTAPMDPIVHQEFFNAVHARHSNQPIFTTSQPSQGEQPYAMALSLDGSGSLANRRKMRAVPMKHQAFVAIEPKRLAAWLSTDGARTLMVDVRSFVQYSHGRIRGAVNVSVPNTILKRPTFTLEKLYEAIVVENDRERLKKWPSMEHIVLYDQGSHMLLDNCASSYLGNKLSQAGFKGQICYLKGGYDAFHASFADQCEISKASDQGRPKMVAPFTAPMPQFENQAFNPFFSNIRQNMELAHGPIRERFPIRLPRECRSTETGLVINSTSPRCIAGISHIENGKFAAPRWLRSTVIPESGPQQLAEMYEKIERVEQRRLQNIMFYHSKHTAGAQGDFPLSIVSGIEMGSLNRYTNVWPFEYTRVKLRQPRDGSTGYINASFIQYTYPEENESESTHVSRASLQCMSGSPQRSDFRRYISTQGPLPDTFADFWQMIWEQNSRVVVMLTKLQEMNKIKCHQYWPESLLKPAIYGNWTVVMTSETSHTMRSDDDEDVIIVRQFELHCGDAPSRTITQLQYTGWMDFGVPDSPEGILRLVQSADQAQVQFETDGAAAPVGPMVVHCSAGCGRSGAFCAIDTVIHRLTNSKDGQNRDLLFDTISRFREQRVSMVQTMRQFVFCYEAIWWWLLGWKLES
ncbi:protein-tyrosine phosphatase-like protein [Dichotomocladium elegans]|nr:protein-tyrosine phosphatase-like protein [Dichotomocladium elegans]